jgi:hypothetical protein
MAAAATPRTGCAWDTPPFIPEKVPVQVAINSRLWQLHLSYECWTALLRMTTLQEFVVFRQLLLENLNLIMFCVYYQLSPKHFKYINYAPNIIKIRQYHPFISCQWQLKKKSSNLHMILKSKLTYKELEKNPRLVLALA